MTPRVFLIDGSALAYRAHFAFAGRTPLITSKGEETSAVFGFTNALLKLIRDEHPEYLAVLFDTLAPTFRHQQYEAYKATRREMPSELARQLPRIDQVIEAFHIPVIRKAGYEADDIMGTLAKQAVEAGLRAVLVSGDKDFLQLVTEDIRVLTFRRGSTEPEWIGPAEVRQRFGVDPPQVIDVLALMGDQSDNIPGVPKIGEKTAIELIQQFGSVQGVLDHVDQVAKKAIQESLRAHVDQARQSLMLVTIETHVPLDDVALDQLAYTGPDYPALQALFRELEFVTLLQTVQQIDHPDAPAPAPSVAVAPETTATVIADLDALDRLVARLAQGQEFAIDLETTSAEPMLADPVGVAVAVAPGEAFYIPVGHLDGPSLDRPAVWERLRPILEDPNIGKCGQNIKYDLIVLRRCGVDLRGITFDTMIAAYLLDPARRHDLGALSLEYLTRSKRAIEGLIGTGKNQRTMAEVPVDAASRYACEDADLTLQLRRVLEPRLDEHGLRLLFDRVEMPLLPVLAEMELAGMAIDVPFLEKMSQQFENDLGQLMGEVYRIAGTEFNINSTKQLGEVLFERLKLPHGRKTKTGYSTDVRVLEELAVEHELPQKLLDYRHLSKLKSTYIDALPRLINPQTGRVHTSFNQTGTETGRLSSNNPNLQNIPIRTDVGREIRKAFIPSNSSHVLVSADYSQVELRLLAHLSGDEQLRVAFQTDADIHTRTAALVFNIPEAMVPADLRRQAKVVNFGIIYGMGPYGLAQALKISHEDARRFIERYFAQYTGVHAYIEHLKQEAREQGYVTTLLGRRRYIPEITSSNFQRREFAERAAINMPVQGTQADLIKVAMVRIHDELRRRGLSAKLILQVHDELVFDAPSDEAAEVSQMVKTQMERAFEPDIHLSVPIKAEVGVGKDWLEAH